MCKGSKEWSYTPVYRQGWVALVLFVMEVKQWVIHS